MARPTLMTHRKFARFASDIGSVALARGILEILWDTCYESGDDYLGTAADIDRRIGWAGEPGNVALSLVACGLPEGHGFIEPVKGENGAATYRVHDLWHHAPDYVSNRRTREQERQKPKNCRHCGNTFFAADPRSEYCSAACRTGGWRDRRAGRDRRVTDPPDTVTDASVTVTDRDGTRAPAPAPAPHTVPPSEVSSVTPSATKPPGTTPTVLTFPTIGKGPKTWDLTSAQCAEWQDAYPGLDVRGECRKALEWVKANNPKTAKGMRSFLVNWFNRAVQRGGNSRPLSAVNGTRVNTQVSPAVAARIRAAQEAS